MSIDHSDQFHLPDAPELDPSLEATVTHKFDMCLFRSCLTENHVKNFCKIYAIPSNLHPCAPSANFTMNQLSHEHIGDLFSFQSRVGKGLKPCIKGAPTSLKKWKDKFFLIDRRAAPIAMAWRHHDSSVADVLPGPSEYNAADVATLLQVPIQLHKPYNSLLYVAVLTMAEFLHLPDLGACKIVAGTLLPPNFPVDTHLSTPATRLEDVPLKTPAMENAEIACRKVIVVRERKKQRAEEHLASKAVGKVGSKRRVAQEGNSRKRKTPATAPSSEQVYSPQPINQVVPNQPLVTGNVRESALNARLDILRDQMDEHLDAGHDQSFARDDSGPGPRGDDRGERGENDGRDDGQHVGPNVEGSAALCSCMDDREAESRDRVRAKYDSCKKQLADLQVAYDAKVSSYGQLTHDYEDALRREEAVELEKEKKKSDELVVSLMLFETHYPYVDKLARAYLLDPSELQNMMPDGAGPTPGGGPRSSPSAHS
ncbi:hypothetical protein Tco_0435391 [Tanacetum coccineum]